MVSDFRLVLLTTVACFQLVLTADPPAIAYVDFKDRMPTGSLYLARPLIEPPTAAMARYFSSKGVYNMSPPRTLFTCILYYSSALRSCPRHGGAENAGVENAGVDSRGGKCGSGKSRSDNVWKAVRTENS